MGIFEGVALGAMLHDNGLIDGCSLGLCEGTILGDSVRTLLESLEGAILGIKVGDSVVELGVNDGEVIESDRVLTDGSKLGLEDGG